ncbi:MAG: hypothetical protein JZU55_16775, partial [Afipia sp.]|nr:hypothetical protein [Afipia sp.]
AAPVFELGAKGTMAIGKRGKAPGCGHVSSPFSFPDFPIQNNYFLTISIFPFLASLSGIAASLLTNVISSAEDD